MAALVVLFTLTAISCQDEIDVLEPGPDESETITSSSVAATLMQRTAANDGSHDNIIDRFSCGTVVLPVTVSVNGIEITIDSEEDIEYIEKLFDEFEDDEDILEIFFPITIVMGDFTEITINSQSELEALIDECEEEDDDIECIDFKYPITFFTYDANNQQTGTVVIESDRQMHLFFKELSENDRVALQFPVTLILYDGSEIVVDSNAELVAAIQEAKDECDEDDDNDYNDDDFDKERLDAYLVECPWIVTEVKRENVDQTPQYRDYVLNFFENGTVVARAFAGAAIEGTWQTRVTDSGVKLTLDFDTLLDFNLEWIVYEIEEGKIKLYTEGGNRIRMKQACDLVDQDPNTLREILRECVWIIKRVKYNGEPIDRLLGYEFEFQAEGVVTLSNGVNTSQGSWEISETANGTLAVALSFGDEPQVNFEWPVRELTHRYIRFEVEGYQLIVERYCENEDDDDDVHYIRDILMEGSWMVAKHTKGDIDDTQVFAEYQLQFNAEHVLAVSVNQDPILDGLWRVYRDCEHDLRIVLNFGQDLVLSELNHRWGLISITENRIELKAYNEANAAYEVLVLER